MSPGSVVMFIDSQAKYKNLDHVTCGPNYNIEIFINLAVNGNIFNFLRMNDVSHVSNYNIL